MHGSHEQQASHYVPNHVPLRAEFAKLVGQFREPGGVSTIVKDDKALRVDPTQNRSKRLHTSSKATSIECLAGNEAL